MENFISYEFINASTANTEELDNFSVTEQNTNNNNNNNPFGQSNNGIHLNTFIERQCSLHNYENVYISFGSKHNKYNHLFQYPEQIQMNQYSSNAAYQMVPQFIRDHICRRGFIVVVDQFNNSDILNLNRDILKNIIKQYPLLDIVIVDFDITVNPIEQLLELFIYMAVVNNLPSHNFMVCNYIRFSHPNRLEENIEDIVPVKIQKTLDTLADGKYATCFYQWYGYHYYMYNLVYNYKLYNSTLRLNLCPLLQLFEQTMNKMQLNENTMCMVEMQPDILNVGNTRLIWDRFCEQSIDICTHKTEFVGKRRL